MDAVPELSPKARRRLLAVLMVWFSMALIDVGIVNVALPSLQHDLAASSSDLQWVLSGYALSFGAVLIAAGRAGDILGQGGLFFIGMLVFTAASLGGALAPDPLTLNIARLVQGLGAGAMSPQVYGMVQRHFRGSARGRAFGLLGMVTSLSVAVAPGLGGLLIDLGGPHWGWRLGFLVNVPIGAIGAAVAWRWLPQPLLHWRQRPTGGAHGLWAALDPVGSLLAALAVLAFLFPFVQWHAGAAVWMGVPIGVALGMAWVAWERGYARRGWPAMVDLKLFRVRSFSYGLSIQMLYFLGMTSVWVLVALYAQEAAGFSALATGVLGMPAAILSAFSARWAGQRVSQLGRKLVVVGQLVAILALVASVGVMLAQAHFGISLWWAMPTLAVYGLGQGAVVSPNQTLTLAAVPFEHAGSAGALISTSQRVGASVGIAVVTGATFAALANAGWATAILAGYGLIVALMAAGTLLGVLDWRHARVAQA